MLDVARQTNLRGAVNRIGVYPRRTVTDRALWYFRKCFFDGVLGNDSIPIPVRFDFEQAVDHMCVLNEWSRPAAMQVYRQACVVWKRRNAVNCSVEVRPNLLA